VARGPCTGAHTPKRTGFTLIARSLPITKNELPHPSPIDKLDHVGKCKIRSPASLKRHIFNERIFYAANHPQDILLCLFALSTSARSMPSFAFQ
jgi:hypothetical protein